MSAPSHILPPGSKAKLTVVKGIRTGKTYGVREGGVTYIGRQGAQPVDINLNEHEKPVGVVKVNRFALVYYDKAGLGIADTGTLPSGTIVNRAKIPPGKRFPIKAEDQIQIGNVVLQVKVLMKKKTGAQK